MDCSPGFIIKEFLVTARMDQKEFAAAMGFSRGYISLVVNGHRPITERFLWRFYTQFARPGAAFYLPEATNALNSLAQGAEKPH
jgi:plasmid maintenance system antidote protein VapI